MTMRPFGRYNRIHVTAAPIITRTYFVVASGGGASTGIALYQRVSSGLVTRVYAGSGGGVAAGLATLARARAYRPSGGGVGTGVATFVYQPVGGLIYAYAGSGTAVSSGAAQTTDTYAFITWAAFEIPTGLPSTFPVDHVYVGTGGGISAGAGTRIRTIVRIGSGGSVASGLAVTLKTTATLVTDTGDDIIDDNGNQISDG